MGEALKINKIAVIGGGVMGQGIAIALAKKGYRPYLIEVVVDLEEVKARLGRSFKREKLAGDAVVLENSLSFVKEADLIIEAISESMADKQHLFEKISASCSAEAIIASNTSSLSIADLSKATAKPGNFIGLHFFNPAYAIDLVEICPGPLTSEDTVKTIADFGRNLGKQIVQVKDSPGFIVNRLLFIMINEAARLFESGVASVKDINVAMQVGANHPIGPLALADLIGIDVCLSILETLNRKFPEGRFKPCQIFYNLVSRGCLGRKVKKGFFNIDK